LTLNPATAAARDTLYHNACHGCHGKDVQPYGGRGRTCGSLPSPSIEMRCGACCMMVRCSPRACRASPLTPRSRLGRSTLSSGQRRAELARQQAVPSTRP
jgi:hypothetical protein